MCDFSADPETMSIDEAASEFREHLAELHPGVRRMHLGPGGSFFDDREVPSELRAAVLQSASVLPNLRSVGVETRPSLVSFPKLLDAVKSLPKGVRDLTLGFGLECLDPLIREVAVNKGYNTTHIDRAVSVIEKVNQAQCDVTVDFEVYVLLKPLFMTESEAIDEAVQTIGWSFARGATTVALFMNTIKQNTVQGYLSRREDLNPPFRFEAPYFRSAIEVLQRLPRGARAATQVLGPQSGVLAEGQPQGCPLCTPLMLGALMGFNFTRSDEILELAASSWCPCKLTWLTARKLQGPPMLTRLDQGISMLEDAWGKHAGDGVTEARG